MKKTILPVLLLSGAIWAGSTDISGEDIGATYFDGKQLLRHCKQDTGDQSFCQGYIRGIADGFTMLGILKSQGYEFRGVCIPLETADETIVTSVVANLRQTDADLSLPAADFAYAALLTEFACGGGENTR